MTKGKSTWKYNKLLTARRNYFDIGGVYFTKNELSGRQEDLFAKIGDYNLVSKPPEPQLLNVPLKNNLKNNLENKKNFLGLDWSNPFKGTDVASTKNSLLSTAGSAIGSIGGGLLSGGMSSGAGNVLQGLSSVAAAIPGPWGAVASAGLGVLGGLTNRMFGSKMNTENIAKVEANINNLKNFQSDASDFDTLSQNWGNTAMGTNFANSYIGKDGWLSSKAKNKAKALRTQMEQANAWAQSTLENNANNIGLQQANMLEQNYAAYGGPLLFSDGGSIYIKPENRGKFTETKRRTGKTTEELTHSKNPLTRKRAIFALNSRHWNKHSNGGILDKEEINPGLDAIIKARLALDSHFGNPTARRMTNYDTRSYTFPDGIKGNVYVGSYGNYVTPQIQDVDGELKFIEDPWSKENWERSEAQSMKFESPRDAEYFAKNYKRFAPMMSLYSKGGIIQNAREWHHAFGGELATNGSLFTNGLLYINNGGSHESNPHEGVQLGVDPEGTPNLVEEGETVFNDFVFSKRLMVPKAFKRKYKMGGLKDISFAEMSKRMAKESEERPNDPISLRGLQAMMRDLAMTQEALKEAQRPNQYAYGGNIFATRGQMKTKKDTGDWSGHYKFYGQDANDALQFMTNGDYTDKYREYVNSISDSDMAANYNTLQKWYKYATKEQKKTNRYKNLDAYFKANPSLLTYNFSSGTLPKGLYEFTKNGGLDKKIGGRHYAIMSPEQRNAMFGKTPSNVIEKHMLRSLDGKPTAMPEADIYYTGTKDGYTWADRFKDKYTIANNGAYEESKDKEGNTIKTYYYDPVKKSTKKNNYYYNDNGKWIAAEGDNPVLDIMNKGKYRLERSVANNSGGNDYLYSLEKEKKMPKPLPTDWRYAPILGLAGAALSDAFGLTNKPNYSNANAILEASRGAGTYQPVKFNPIGNYLTYRPFDRDYYINKMNAEAGAARRSLLNTSGGNRATAMAGILAADNNYMNQIGNLARQAEEYNLAQRQHVEDFNRATNTTNSQGFLQADIANQQALMNSRQLGLKGAMTAYEMMNNARLAADAAKSANLSKLFTSIGNIGRENMAWNWRNFGIATDSFGHVGDGEQTELLTHYNTAAKGGKLKKKKKGLTI